MKDATRRLILRVHGALMMLLGAVNATGATLGWLTGAGPMGFLREHPLGHVGLLQAYLLIAVIGASLWLATASGSGFRRWHVIGALAHCAVLPVYALHWSRFASYSPNGGDTRAVVLFHLAMIAVEGFALSRPTRG